MKMLNDRFYLVDFDGVICDSRIECMVTSYLAYQQLRGNKNRKPAYSVDQIPEAHVTRFIDFRYLARTAREFMVIWDLVEADKVIDPDLGLDHQSEIDQELLMRYHELFYSTRYIWMETDMAGWIGIHRFFPGMVEWLSARLSQGRAHIVSSKDRRSILTILRNNGIEIADEDVSGCDEGDKHEHFKNLAENLPDREFAFLDDNLENLETAEKHGIDSYLCAWGYTWEGGISAAQKKGFHILELDQVASLT